MAHVQGRKAGDDRAEQHSLHNNNRGGFSNIAPLSHLQPPGTVSRTHGRHSDDAGLVEAFE
jgi:hypothetical protein